MIIYWSWFLAQSAWWLLCPRGFWLSHWAMIWLLLALSLLAHSIIASVLKSHSHCVIQCFIFCLLFILIYYSKVLIISFASTICRSCHHLQFINNHLTTSRGPYCLVISVVRTASKISYWGFAFWSHLRTRVPLKVKVKVSQSCLTLCNPMDYTVHRILQARILEWVPFPFSRGSSQSRDHTQVSRIAGGFFTSWATREALPWKQSPKQRLMCWWLGLRIWVHGIE